MTCASLPTTCPTAHRPSPLVIALVGDGALQAHVAAARAGVEAALQSARDSGDEDAEILATLNTLEAPVLCAGPPGGPLATGLLQGNPVNMYWPPQVWPALPRVQCTGVGLVLAEGAV